jgi:hypothetical protein
MMLWLNYFMDSKLKDFLFNSLCANERGFTVDIILYYKF